MYRAMGLAHATTAHHLQGLRARLRDEEGQGTVEYVGLILLIGTVLMVAGGITDGEVATDIVKKIKAKIDSAAGGK